MGDFKINEKSVFTQSGSDEPVLANTVTLKPNSLKTVTNNYDFLKGGELNSLGYLNHNFFGCSYYLSSTQSIAHNTYVEITGTWTKVTSTGSAGSDDADMFGKFSSGRWTPTVSGYYFCSYSVYIPGIDDQEWLIGSMRKNGASPADVTGLVRIQSPIANADLSVSGSGIFALDTNDYVSVFVYHSEGGTQNVGTTTTQFSATYVGTSDL